MAALCPPRPVTPEAWTREMFRTYPHRPLDRIREYELLKSRFRALFPSATPAQYQTAMRAIARATGV